MEFDKDLTARQEARELARRAETAQRKLTELSQSQLDAIVEAVAKPLRHRRRRWRKWRFRRRASAMRRTKQPRISSPPSGWRRRFGA